MDLHSLLKQLENAELVRSFSDPDVYAFKHTLTQETAYRSLLKTQRQQLHRQVALSIEQVLGSDETSDSVLGYHWEQAHVPERARYYLFRAGQNAARRFANAEAVDAYTRALALGGSAPWQETAATLTARAEVYEFLSEYPRALADYEAALALLRDKNRATDECHILSRMAWLHWLAGQSEQALATAQQAETLAHGLQDNSSGLRAYLVAGLVAQARGHIPDSYPRLRKALQLSRKLDERVLEGESLFFLGIQNNFMGRFGRAAVCARQAYAIKASLNDHVGEIVTLYLQARAEAGRGRYDAALASLEAGRAVAEETQNPFGLAQYPNTRAWLAAELGDWRTAYELDRAGLDVARRAPVRPPEISTLLNLVLDCIALNKCDEADDYLLQASRWVGRAGFGFHAWRWQIRLLDARARILLAFSLYDEASQVVSSLLDWAIVTRSDKYKVRALLLRAPIHLAEGNARAAFADLVAARDLADVMCHLPSRIQARRGLCEWYDREGESEQVRQLTGEIDQVILEIDQRLNHIELRRSFEDGLKCARPVSIERPLGMVHS